MSTVKMVPEDEATGRVKEVYDEIMESLGIDFVPNMYKHMATKLVATPLQKGPQVKSHPFARYRRM